MITTDAGSDATADAGPPQSCWPDIPRFPQGSVQLGTGLNGYAGWKPMPDVLPLEYGTQDGYNLVAHVRMTGFPPGDPDNVFDPGNPRTRILAYFDDTNVPLNVAAECAFRLGYVPTGTGEFEMVSAVPVIFDTCWRSDNLIGRPLRIELEMLDSSGGYTTDTKVVTAAAPVGFYPDQEMNSPGCVPPP